MGVLRERGSTRSTIPTYNLLHVTVREAKAAATNAPLESNRLQA